MNFNEYLQKALQEDSELKEKYDLLQKEYEIIENSIKSKEENLNKRRDEI